MGDIDIEGDCDARRDGDRWGGGEFECDIVFEGL